MGVRMVWRFGGRGDIIFQTVGSWGIDAVGIRGSVDTGRELVRGVS